MQKSKVLVPKKKAYTTQIILNRYMHIPGVNKYLILPKVQYNEQLTIGAQALMRNDAIKWALCKAYFSIPFSSLFLSWRTFVWWCYPLVKLLNGINYSNGSLICIYLHRHRCIVHFLFKDYNSLSGKYYFYDKIYMT